MIHTWLCYYARNLSDPNALVIYTSRLIMHSTLGELIYDGYRESLLYVRPWSLLPLQQAYINFLDGRYRFVCFARIRFVNFWQADFAAVFPLWRFSSRHRLFPLVLRVPSIPEFLFHRECEYASNVTYAHALHCVEIAKIIRPVFCKTYFVKFTVARYSTRFE